MPSPTTGLEDIDLWDMDMFQRQEHHDALTRLRETEPGIHWVDEGVRGPGYWAITRHAHVKEINRLATIFSSNEGGTQMDEPNTQDETDNFQRDNLLLSMDPPRHTRYRKLVNRGFTPRMIGLLEDYLQNRTTIIMDKISDQGACDFVGDIAAELPLQAIAEMMGIPLEDRSRIFEWSNKMIGADDPDYAADPSEVIGAFADLYAYSSRLQDARRDSPADDIVTTLLNADIDGEHLTENEFDMFFLLLCVAGNETTRNTITRGMHAFFEFPEQWKRFIADPDATMDTMVEEVLRWATPVVHFRRQCLEDYEIGGVKIRAGDKVVMWHMAANRDPRTFDDPWTFDIGRNPNDHVAFGGGGPHYCLGANLAKMEIRMMFKALAERLPDIAPDGDVAFLRSNFIGGVKAMPVRFTPTESTGTAPMDRLGSAAGASESGGYGSRGS